MRVSRVGWRGWAGGWHGEVGQVGGMARLGRWVAWCTRVWLAIQPHLLHAMPHRLTRCGYGRRAAYDPTILRARSYLASLVRPPSPTRSSARGEAERTREQRPGCARYTPHTPRSKEGCTVTIRN